MFNATRTVCARVDQPTGLRRIVTSLTVTSRVPTAGVSRLPDG